MDEQTRAKALETLDNMERMVQGDRLRARWGSYFDGADVWHREHSAVDTIPVSCSGPHMCLLGSLWVAHGDAYVTVDHGNADFAGPELAGVFQNERAAYLAERPALAALFDALNAEAEQMARESTARVNECFLTDETPSYAEALFEGGSLEHDDLLDLIRRTRERVGALAPA